MKIKLAISICILSTLAFLSSCGGPGKEASDKETNGAITVNNKQLQKSVGLFKDITLPFTVDTALLFKLEKGDSLGSFEIKTLAANCFKHDLLESFEYDLNTFYKIDSIKAAGKYRQYCDSVSIGMTKVSAAHALGEFQLDANTLILVWGLNTSSYEACPYSSTWAAYFTVIYKGNVGETFLLGEYISAGDAPVSMERTVSSKFIADGTITMDVYQVNDEDMDLPEVEITKEQYTFAVKDGAIKLLSEKKNPAVKEKRKKTGA